MNKTYTFDIKLHISYDQIADLLCSGYEGGRYGYHYWARPNREKSVEPAPSVIDKENRFEEDFWLNGETYWYVHWPLFNGSLAIEEISETNEPNVIHYLDLAKMQKGLQVMLEKYPKQFIRIIDGSTDAEVADLFVQCSLFGEERYA